MVIPKSDKSWFKTSPLSELGFVGLRGLLRGPNPTNPPKRAAVWSSSDTGSLASTNAATLRFGAPFYVVETPAIVLAELLAALQVSASDAASEDLVPAVAVGGVSSLKIHPGKSGSHQKVQVRSRLRRIIRAIEECLLLLYPRPLPARIQSHLDGREDARIFLHLVMVRDESLG